MAEVVGLLTSAVVKIAGDKLGAAVGEQATLMCNFRDDLGDMNHTLESISAVLKDAERRSVKEHSVRLWLKRLKDAAYDISDIVDDYQVTKATAKMPGMLSCFPIACKKIVLANKMKSMKERLTKINKQREEFTFTSSIRASIEQGYDERETTSAVDESQIIGRDKEKEEIINRLSANGNEDETMILPIYGLGGMGKSTLAQLVYNDTQFKKYDHRVWVYVSQEFDLMKIGSSIISQVEGNQQNINSMQLINQRLDVLLPGKKILIVIDDLWEEKYFEVEKLKNMLRVGKKDNMTDVIVTTRKEDIANATCTKKPYKLQPLKDGMCWEIIKRSSRFENQASKEHLEKIGLDIARKCGGVALAAKALGYMLQSKDLNGWLEMNNSDIWNGSSEDDNSPHKAVLPSLKLSLEMMPPDLRLCFSYCAMFPKGHDIIENDLIHQWIALDFIEPSKGKEYTKELLGMSFLQHSKLPSISGKHVVRYTMHDLVHDLARSAMGDELIVFDAAKGSDTSEQKYCRYALLTSYDWSMKLSRTFPTKLRALQFSDSGKLGLPDGSLSFVKFLRILDFSPCSSISLPSSVGQLKHLRCLIAPRMQNERPPECITELSKLQYLNLHGSSQILALPESIGKLGCLIYLNLSGCSSISKLPESFGDLKSVMHLNLSGCSGISKLPESFGEFKSLMHLDLSGCSGIVKLTESFGGLKKLLHLDMSGCSEITELPDSLGNLINLQHLELSSSSRLKALPESIGKLGCLIYLSLSGCTGISNLPESFGDLKSLMHLNLSGCSSIVKLSESFGGLRNLLHLDMSSCSGITGLPGSLGNLTDLQHLDLSKTFGVKAIPESLSGLTKLQYLNLSFCHCLERLPEAIGSLINLLELNMSGCRNIKELPESFQNLRNLEHLDLSGCNGTKRLPGALRGFIALQHLNMNSFQIDHSSRYHLLGHGGLPDALGNLINLKYLNLSSNSRRDGLFVFGGTCFDFFGRLTNLEHLDLSKNFGLSHLPQSIGNLKMLHTLDLSGCWMLESLPENIRAIKTLKTLMTDGCSHKLIEHANSLFNDLLVTLPLFKVRADDVRACSNLHLLEGANVGELNIRCLENVRSLEEARTIKLLDKQNLSELTLAWTWEADRLLEDKDLLEQLVPPRGLKGLQLGGYRSTSLPRWLLDIGHHLPNLVSITLCYIPICTNLPPLGHIPNLEKLSFEKLHSITKIDRDFGGGKGGFRRLLSFQLCSMQGLEEWSTTYCGEDGVDEFMFPMLDYLRLEYCPRLRLKPRPPTFRECFIDKCDQVLSSLDEMDNISHLTPSTPCTKLEVSGSWGPSCPSLRLFHHFPALQELKIRGFDNLTNLPESMQLLASLEHLELSWCESITGLPEFLGDLPSLKSIRIWGCKSIKSLPACMTQLTNLQKLDISDNPELKNWCETEENKMKLAHIKFII